jgi:L-seryl-tRNA(Ser) seleniumtransferase
MQKRRSDPPATTASRVLQQLPGVSRLLECQALRPILDTHGAALITKLLRQHLEALRERVLAGQYDAAALPEQTSEEAIARAVGARAASMLAPRPRPVINATGVVVHTNLGRATLSAEAATRLAEAARGYVDLEYDVAGGSRGSRLAHLQPLMGALFPGRGFTVVNNNAAAILLCLRALSRGKRVVVSRGELVEIGGSFRIPEILQASGAELHEVGTTNRTRLADYERAVTPETGLLLKVHTSNFRVVGFTEEATVAQLAALARSSGLPLVVDWGSGDLVDLEPLDIRDEIPVSRILEDGADLVTFSGDKLLGGPQSGFVVGREDLVARLREDPLARVCRLDRLRIGALHSTLAAYVRGRAFEEVPVLRMLAAGADEIGRRAERVVEEVARRAGARDRLEVIDGVSRPGGGSSPAGERPTRLIAVLARGGDAGPLESLLRSGDPPVVGRVREGRLLLDLRTVLPEQEAAFVERLAAVLLEA